MSFCSWCAYRASEIGTSLNQRYQQHQRRQFAHDAQQARLAMWSRWVSQLGPGITRDILEGRVEP